MFGLFKKKKDPYLERVAGYLKERLPLADPYALAEECLRDLHGYISKGVLKSGPNPRADVMAYFCLCQMVYEAGPNDNRGAILQITVMGRLLEGEIKNREGFSPLEKGIMQFGAAALGAGAHTANAKDLNDIKSGAVAFIMELMNGREPFISREDIASIVQNNAAIVGDREVANVGDKILALSSLSNATGYFLDQGDLKKATVCFECASTALNQYFKANMASLSERQRGAFMTVVKGFQEIGTELIERRQAAGMR